MDSNALVVILSSRGEEKLKNVKVGILASIALGLTHGSFFVPLQTSHLSIFVTFLPLAIGMFSSLMLLVTLQKVKIRYDAVSTVRMVLAGLMLGSGNYMALLTIKYLGVAQGYPLTQLGIIVNALWGTLVFKEVTLLKKEFFALVDSGATVSIFRAEVASYLGIEVSSGKEIYLDRVGGRIKRYIHKLEVETAGKQFTCPIVFSYEYLVSFNLLGRDTFFKQFRITFEEKNNKVTLA